MFVAIAALVGTGAVVRSIPYEPGMGKKQLAWLAHCAVVGAVVAPICLLGGPILTRAAWYTAGMVGGLSTGEQKRQGNLRFDPLEFSQGGPSPWEVGLGLH